MTWDLPVSVEINGEKHSIHDRCDYRVILNVIRALNAPDLTDEEKDLMRKYNILWGCDECQRYCPHNLNAVKTPIEFFYKDRIPCLTEELLDSMSDEDFEKRAFAWRKRKTIERNLHVLANK